MPKTNFSDNTGGKLLGDEFLTVRLHDGKYQIGQLREIYLRDQLQGTGQVMSVVQFLLKDLPDIISFMDCGKDTQHLKTMLGRYYKNVHEQSLFDVIVIRWKERIPEAQTKMFKTYWNKLVENASQGIDVQMAFNYL